MTFLKDFAFFQHSGQFRTCGLRLRDGPMLMRYHIVLVSKESTSALSLVIGADAADTNRPFSYFFTSLVPPIVCTPESWRYVGK